MPNVLITGANRGLGLEFTRQYLADGWSVVATCRNAPDAEALKALKTDHLRIIDMAVDDEDAIARVAGTLSGEAIDLLINNAGVFGPRAAKLGNLDPDAWGEVFRINTIAPIKVAEAFTEQVAAAQGTIATVSSKMGSIALIPRADEYIYRSSKAALNSAHRSLAMELEPRGITCAVFHPGWVRTDMGGAEADIDATESVSGMRRVIAGLDITATGLFWNYDGEQLPW